MVCDIGTGIRCVGSIKTDGQVVTEDTTKKCVSPFNAVETDDIDS